MKYLFGFVALIAGLAFGNDFPDIDQKTDLLLHRSIVTHGPLVPLIIFAIATGIRAIPLRWFTLGITLGIAIHLSFDLFPKGWSGFALISVPIYGWMPQWFSWTWIAGSMVACTYMAMRLVRNVFDGSVFILSLIGAFGYISTGEDSLWRP
ncbi:MAG: hypothetical protein IIB17_06235, partial [Chloroflexi bacterium]|nr:hypothetical protein [Chloroflexota bacterium]